ncbi:MAG: NTP transferase domain-containing protein [Puniceicoccales bacterium]|jgi:NDP-sugar pyrophosphorylase family protein|nr:NTP transferase domain-containing protein [Puniceicoccales bacterium]
MITTAFVLGAGLGTRLRPLTDRMPKPLLPVAGKPMICHVFERLAEAGARRFIVNTHHCQEAYGAAFPDARWRGLPIQFVHEPVLLDTGGGLKNIEALLAPDDESLFIHNGDVYAAPPLRHLAALHAANRASATLLLRPGGPHPNVRFSAAGDGAPGDGCGGISKAGVVLDLRGRLGATDGILATFTGVYCVRREFFGCLERGRIESVVEGFLRSIAAAPGSIRALLSDSGFWHDLGTLEDYEAARQGGHP